jgi:hypothetical protein
MKNRKLARIFSVAVLAMSLPVLAAETDEYYDSHVHLTNYIQEGLTARQYLDVVGDRVGRSVLFGIPLQLHWSDRVTGKFAPDLLPGIRHGPLLLLLH